MEAKDTKIEYIQYEEMYLPDAETIQNDFGYGKSKEQLDYNIAIRNKPENNNNIIVKTGNYTANWTGLLTVNLPFTPKLIRFTFFPDTTWATWSDGQITATSQTCLARKYTSTTQLIQQDFRATEGFYIQEFLSSSVCTGNVNIITNGFTIQANSNTFSINLKWIAECFG